MVRSFHIIKYICNIFMVAHNFVLCLKLRFCDFFFKPLPSFFQFLTIVNKTEQSLAMPFLHLEFLTFLLLRHENGYLSHWFINCSEIVHVCKM